MRVTEGRWNDATALVRQKKTYQVTHDLATIPVDRSTE